MFTHGRFSQYKTAGCMLAVMCETLHQASYFDITRKPRNPSFPQASCHDATGMCHRSFLKAYTGQIKKNISTDIMFKLYSAIENIWQNEGCHLHTHSCACIHAITHPCTHTHMHTCARAHTHTQTHTQV